jgi:hypothetical protein
MLCGEGHTELDTPPPQHVTLPGDGMRQANDMSYHGIQGARI